MKSGEIVRETKRRKNKLNERKKARFSHLDQENTVFA